MNFLLVIWLHYVGDFLCQTNKIAVLKSKSNLWLLLHVGTYTVPLLWFGWEFALLNGLLHFVTDFFTSRLGSWARKENRTGLFFKILGADQAIHMTCLFLTLPTFAHAEAYNSPIKLKPIEVKRSVNSIKPPSNWSVDEELIQYVESFKHDYFVFNKKILSVGPIVIQKGSVVDRNDAGVCYRGGKRPVIQIRDLGWSNLGDCQRKGLVYHEMGHCILREEHTKGGIMNPELISEKDCKANFEYYKKFLFANERKRSQIHLEYYFYDQEETDE